MSTYEVRVDGVVISVCESRELALINADKERANTYYNIPISVNEIEEPLVRCIYLAQGQVNPDPDDPFRDVRRN